MDRTHIALVALALLAAPALAGCIGSDDSAPAEAADDGSGAGPSSEADQETGNETSDPGETLEWKTVERTVVAEDILPHQPPQNYTYNVEGSDDPVVEVPVNSTVELTLESHQQNALDHDIKVGDLAESEAIGPGESLTLTFDVTEPGPTPFWCTIGDHRDRGMEGVLVVNAR